MKCSKKNLKSFFHLLNYCCVRCQLCFNLTFKLIYLEMMLTFIEVQDPYGFFLPDNVSTDGLNISFNSPHLSGDIYCYFIYLPNNIFQLLDDDGVWPLVHTFFVTLNIWAILFLSLCWILISGHTLHCWHICHDFPTWR